jgi:hypothetical protein
MTVSCISFVIAALPSVLLMRQTQSINFAPVIPVPAPRLQQAGVLVVGLAMTRVMFFVRLEIEIEGTPGVRRIFARMHRHVQR